MSGDSAFADAEPEPHAAVMPMLSLARTLISSEVVSTSPLCASSSAAVQTCWLKVAWAPHLEGPLQPPSMRLLWRPSRWAATWGC